MISLNYVLNYFEQAFNLGRNALRGEAFSLFHILAALEVIIAGLYLTLGSGGAQLQAARRILFMGFLLFVIQNYDTLASQVIGGFIYAGELAGGSATPIATFQNPDAIVSAAFRAVGPGMEQLKTSTAQGWFGLPTVDALITLLCMCIGLLAFFFIAIQAFITYLEFLLITSVGLILIPFGVFRPTAFLAEKTFGAIVGFGIKLMVLAVILAVTSELMNSLALPDTITWQNAFNFVLISLALAFLSWHAPASALALLHGQPSLSLATAAATGMTAGAVGTASIVGGGIAARGISGTAIQSATALGGMASAGYQLGSQGARQVMSPNVSTNSTSASRNIATKAAATTAGLVGAAAAPVAGVANAAYRSFVQPITGWTKNQMQSGFSAGQTAVPLYSRNAAKQKQTASPAKEQSQSSKKEKTEV